MSPDQRANRSRPVRDSYRHVGKRPQGPLRDLTPAEAERYAEFGYVKFEEHSPERSSATGRFWTKAQLESGCNTITRMGSSLAETWAANPNFYGRTFCTHCRDYFAVAEFVWIEPSGADGPVLGS